MYVLYIYVNSLAFADKDILHNNEDGYNCNSFVILAGSEHHIFIILDIFQLFFSFSIIFLYKHKRHSRRRVMQRTGCTYVSSTLLIFCAFSSYYAATCPDQKKNHNCQIFFRNQMFGIFCENKNYFKLYEDHDHKIVRNKKAKKNISFILTQFSSPIHYI